MKLLVPLIFISSTIAAVAQTSEDRAYILQRTNTEALEQLKVKHEKRYQRFIDSTDVPQVFVSGSEGKIRVEHLAGFTAEGQPIYDYDDNVNSAITSGVDHIWVGGSTGLDLDGTDIVIGHWEASGLALPNHQELIGKITHLENQSVTSHATHTACTMLGTGVDPDARGFASEASILSRRSNNDEAEIADFALDGGILSNHSYSTGDPHGTTVEYGQYNDNAQEWDDILYNAPYLFASKSAGNNRNDGVNVADNGYDIIYTIAGSKNIMTVGAVNDVLDYTGPGDVIQSPFSNWGPTDDWRIKPDITANGISLYSASNGSSTDYDVKSGTSMSAPSVTGAVALLQQHYHNLNGVYMKAATVKSLLINTTDEVGAEEGPDFVSGWGLLNAKRAAEVISNDGESAAIKELTLHNNETYSEFVHFEGGGDAQISIAWTDPAGNIVGGFDNTTPVLVNDLDLKLILNGTVYLPWMFEPNGTANNFTEPAAKGDNYRDNVERIDIQNVPEGNYILVVTHKDNLENGVQDFSLVINGMGTPTADVGNLEAEAIQMFPNPAKDLVTIKIPAAWVNTSTQIQVMDTFGRMIRQYDAVNTNHVINTSDLASGLYIVKVRTEDREFQKRLIVGQ